MVRAQPSHAGEAVRATLHRRATSTRENSSHKSPPLTAALPMKRMRPRARDGAGWSGSSELTRNPECYHAAFTGYNFRTDVKILMIAPEPFFEPRGTPFSEYHR